MEINFDRFMAILGAILAIILVVLDKAGKLKGPVLLGLLGLAAVMTLPLALGNTWVRELPWGMLKFSRALLMVSIVVMGYAVLAVWVSSGTDAPETVESKKTELDNSPSFYLAMEGGHGELRKGPMTSPMLLFEHVQDSSGKYMALSPVDVTFILRAMNTGPKATGISWYEAEALATNGTWERIYVPIHLHYEAALIDKGLGQSYLFDLDRCGFDRQLGRVILKPNETVMRGWVFFEFSRGKWNDYVGVNHPLTIRMTLHTLDGKSFTGIINHDQALQTQATENTIYFPKTVDLRAARILQCLPGWEWKPLSD